jgi:hypothetical protein
MATGVVFPIRRALIHRQAYYKVFKLRASFQHGPTTAGPAPRFSTVLRVNQLDLCNAKTSKKRSQLSR